MMLKYHFIVLRDTDPKAGAIVWLDEWKNNRNHVSGVLPDQSIEGAQESSIPHTIINYCCLSDGFPSNPIFLPTDEPFFLFKYKTHECQQCQQVKRMSVSEEWFKWDTEDMFPFNERNGIYTLWRCGQGCQASLLLLPTFLPVRFVQGNRKCF